MALVFGALLATGGAMVTDRATQGALVVVPQTQTVTARARQPLGVTVRLGNRGRGIVHVLGVSGG